MLVDVKDIKTGRNYRRDFSDIIELAKDIEDHGLLQPLVINEDLELLAGERRLKAIKYLEWSQVECNMIKGDEQMQHEITLVENLQRKDTNPIEDGTAFKSYIKNHGGTYVDLAKKLHLTPDFISDRIKLLSLINDAQILVSDGIMPIYMGLAMAKLTSEKQGQIVGFFDFNNLPGKKVFEQFCRDFANSDADAESTLERVEKQNKQKRLSNIIAGLTEDDIQQIVKMTTQTERVYAVQCVFKNSFSNPKLIKEFENDDLIEGDMVFSHLEVVELSEKELVYLKKRALPAFFDYRTALNVLEHVDPHSEDFPSYKIGTMPDGSNKIIMCAPLAYTEGPIFSDMF
jgi:ParB family chromosome partitioning protein